jgi:hypothetical protein
VHVLRAGRPLCARPGTPNEWPAHHRWVAWNMVPKHLAQHGSARYCRTCIGRWGVDDEMRRQRSRASTARYYELQREKR